MNNIALDLPFCHLDDASFNLSNVRINVWSINYDNDRLDSLVFNPTIQLGYNSSSDYDDQDAYFPFSSHPSYYYGEGEVNSKISTEFPHPKFSILHINARIVCFVISINLN